MRNIRLLVAYDGTDLCGYQRQAKGMTVQEELEKALTILCAEPISVYGASRTDAGVHAKFQVVTFFTSGSIPAANLPRALLAFLPASIVVWRAEEIPLDWKPRWNILGKEYIYTIHNYLLEDPLMMRYHWHIKKPLNLALMQQGGKLLEGTRDFSTLQGSNSTPANPVKTIYKVAVLSAEGNNYQGLMGQTITIHVIGDGFLYHMVRNLAGLLVDIGLGRIQLSDVVRLLEEKNRHGIGKTAPAQGLCLDKIFFSQDELAAEVKKYL